MERTSLRPFLVASAPNAAVSNVCEARNVPLLVQNKKKTHVQNAFFQSGLLSPSVYLVRH